MKLDEWGNLIVSWASFLDPNEKINTVDDLSKSELFYHLLRILADSSENSVCENDHYKFLQDQYPLLDFGDVESNYKENTILVATVFLIYCSIHHEENVLQKKMTDLPGWTQLCLSDFLKEFVDVPKKEITRELVFSEISKISNPCVASEMDTSGRSSPNFGTPLTYSTSPSTGELSQKSSSKKASKIKKLRSEIESLTILKSELSEELDSTKECVSQLEANLQKKESEINKLKSALTELEIKFHNIEQNPPENEMQNTKLEKLKERMDTLLQENAKLKEELRISKEEKDTISEELQKIQDSSTEILKKLESQRTAHEAERRDLEDKILLLKNTIDELSAANKEQSEYIAELTQPKEDSKRFSDSHGDSLILPEEHLGRVIDLEIHELKELVKNKEIEIESLKTQLQDWEEKYLASSEDFKKKEEKFQSEMETKTNTLKSNLEELRNLECQNIFLSNTIREKDSIVVSMQSSLDILNEEVQTLKNREKALNRELQSRDTYNQQLLKDIDALTVVINENSTEKDLLMKSIAEKENIIQQCFFNLNEVKIGYESQLKTLYSDLEDKRKEIITLEEAKAELASAIEYYQEQMILNESTLKEKEQTIVDNFNIIATLKTDMENHKMKEMVLQSELTLSENIIESLKKEIEREKSENAKLKSILEEKEKELEVIKTSINVIEDDNVQQLNSLNKELDTAKGLIETLEHENETFKKEIKSAVLERELLISKVTSLETEHAGCHEKEARTEAFILELKDKESILKDELNKTTEREAHLQSLLDKKVVSIGILEEDIAQKQQCIKNLENSLKDAIKSKDDTESELRSLLDAVTAEKEKLTSIIEDKNKKIEEYLNYSKNIEKELVQAKNSSSDELNNLKSLKEDAENENNKLKMELQNMATKFKTVELEHSSCDGKIHNAEQIILELRDKESILKEELSKSNARGDSLKIELQNKQTAISSLKEEIKSLKKTLSDKDFDEGILFTKLQAREAEVNKLKLELGEMTEKWEQNKETSREEINIHLKKIQDLDTTIGKLNNQFIKVSRERETLVMELEEKTKIVQDFKSLQRDYDNLKSENEKIVNKLAMKNEEINKIQHELDFSQNQLMKAEADGQLLEQKLNLNNNEIKKLSDNIQVLQKKINNYEDALLNKDNQIERVTKEKQIIMLDLDLYAKKEECWNSQLEGMKKELEGLKARLTLAETEAEKLKLTCSEKEQTIRSIYATLQSQNTEIKEKDNEIVHLQAEIKSLNQMLIEKDNAATSDGKPGKNDTFIKSEGHLYTEEELNKKMEELKTSYEKKVEGYRTTVKKRFAEKLEDLTYSLQNENTDLKEKLVKEQERCAKLQSELWNASDKLLITQEHNRSLLSKLHSRNAYEVVRPSGTLSPLSKARSMEVLSGRNRGIDNFARDISINDQDSSSRRSSIRSLPRGMGKVFPVVDEDGEVFDNRYLADLKAGICNIPAEEDRMSTLQYRNSLCPPHLKSSYPLETQFFTNPKEDEIKSLPGSSSESDLRKVKVHSSYKKPGPPTPSKNGGRPSFQGNEKSCPSTPARDSRSSHAFVSGKEGVVNESFVLRESNSNYRKPDPPAAGPGASKVPTPSRIRALFSYHKRDENSPRRKSMFLRKN